MSEVTAKHKVQELVEQEIDRTSFDELTGIIFDSYKNVDWTNDYLKELRARMEHVSESEARDLQQRAGILATALGDWQAAVDFLQPIKTRKEAAYFLGRAYMGLGSTESAMSALQSGRQADDDFGTDMLMADLFCIQRDPAAARKLCTHYRRKHAEDPDWLYAMGRVLETEGAYDEAMTHYEQAIERDPDHRGSLFRLALNCDLNGDDERARDLYRRCASLKPTFVGALINLGITCEDCGDFEGAVDCYKRVLAIDPAHLRAQLYLKDAESSLTMRIDEETSRRLRAHDEALQLSLADFELSARCHSALDKLNVRTLGDLIRVTEDQLLQFKNFGETSLDEIKDLLARNDLQLAGSSTPTRVAELIEAAQDEHYDDETMGMSIDQLGLSTRSRKCMERLGVSTVGDLLNHTEQELLGTPNFGRTSVAEIKSRLAELDLTLTSDEQEEPGEDEKHEDDSDENLEDYEAEE